MKPEALEALQNYKQADRDGVMVLVSREALDEAIAALLASPPEADQRDAALEEAAKVCEAYIENMPRGVAGIQTAIGVATCAESIRALKRSSRSEGK